MKAHAGAIAACAVLVAGAAGAWFQARHWEERGEAVAGALDIPSPAEVPAAAARLREEIADGDGDAAARRVQDLEDKLADLEDDPVPLRERIADDEREVQILANALADLAERRGLTIVASELEDPRPGADLAEVPGRDRRLLAIEARGTWPALREFLEGFDELPHAALLHRFDLQRVAEPRPGHTLDCRLVIAL